MNILIISLIAFGDFTVASKLLRAEQKFANIFLSLYEELFCHDSEFGELSSKTQSLHFY